MTTLSFIRSTVAALIISAATAVLFSSLLLFFSGAAALQLATTAATFAYLVYLLSNTKARFGKLTTLTSFVLVSGIALYLTPSLLVTAALNVGFIWLVRAVYYHSNVLVAFADLVISVIAFTAAIGAALQSQSVFLALWSFFLAQAMILPLLNYALNRMTNNGDHDKDRLSSVGAVADPEQNFYRAHRDAEQALRRLAQTH